MKKYIILFILSLSLFSTGCKRVQYLSISRPQIDTSTSNQYFLSKGNNQYQGNESVKDINSQDSKNDVLIIEDDGSYHYIK